VSLVNHWVGRAALLVFIGAYAASTAAGSWSSVHREDYRHPLVQQHAAPGVHRVAGSWAWPAPQRQRLAVAGGAAEGRPEVFRPSLNVLRPRRRA
jgi:hypothetical protein